MKRVLKFIAYLSAWIFFAVLFYAFMVELNGCASNKPKCPDQCVCAYDGTVDWCPEFEGLFDYSKKKKK